MALSSSGSATAQVYCGCCGSERGGHDVKRTALLCRDVLHSVHEPMDYLLSDNHRASVPSLTMVASAFMCISLKTLRRISSSPVRKTAR